MDIGLKLRKIARLIGSNKLNELGNRVLQKTAMSLQEAKNIFEIVGPIKVEDLNKKRQDLMKKWHPDVSKDPDATKKSQSINQAYNILKDYAEKGIAPDNKVHYREPSKEPERHPGEDPKNPKTQRFFRNDILSKPRGDNPGYAWQYSFWENKLRLSRDSDGYLTPDSVSRILSYRDSIDREYGSLGKSKEWHEWAREMTSLIYAWEKNYVQVGKKNKEYQYRHKNQHDKDTEKVSGNPAAIKFKTSVLELLSSIEAKIQSGGRRYIGLASNVPSFQKLKELLASNFAPTEELKDAFKYAVNDYMYSTRMHERSGAKPGLYEDLKNAGSAYRSLYTEFNKKAR